MVRRGILVLTIFVVSIFITFIIVSNDNKDGVEIARENVSYSNFKNILSSKRDFADSTYSYDPTNNKVTIDNKYDIYIKNGYYMMNISNDDDRNVYCEIVDAVEKSLGSKESSMNTCNMTLDGVISLGGINSNDYGEYKVLTVNTNEKATLYDDITSHDEDDYINLEEINYTVKIDDYIFSNMKFKLEDESSSKFDICGNLFNKNNSMGNFTFTTFDSNKTPLESKKYTYQNDTNKYESFCVEFNMAEKARYYTIKLD